MIFSAQQLFSDNQAIVATARSTNVIDLGVPGTPPRGAAPLNQDVGKGTPIPINVQVTEDFNNLTSLDVAIEVGATEALGTVVATQNILLADLVAGKTLNLQCLPNGVDQRYLGLRYTVTGTAPTAGQIHAGITMGNQTNK
ncbi:MAG: Bbp16 family capsid cement protein [Candidatus Thiodiazotropha endolucinida]